MKQIKFKPITEEVTLEEIVDSIFSDIGENYRYWDDLEEEIDEKLSEYYELSEEEKEEVIKVCKERFYLDLEKYKEEEINKLSTREKIIDWIKYIIDNDEWFEPGDIGYLLSAEEIVDLIYKNYNN